MNDSFYYLMDNIILLEKCYSQFINDFWFDKIKQLPNNSKRNIYSVNNYRSIVGKFFEMYLQDILKFSFEKVKHFKLKTFDELRVTINNKNQELTDVYIRHDNKVFLAEVKSTGIYDNEKYSGNLNSFYKEGREKFFDAFGMTQLLTAIKLLKNVANQFDKGFPLNKNIKIYPALIVNEKALQTPLMAQVFNQRFQELLSNTEINLIHISPLSIIHISDWETMEEELNRNPKFIWDILKYNTRNSTFIPPFFNSLNRKQIKPDYKKVRVLFEELISKYSTSNMTPKLL
jgi:hypothetical protein